MKNTPIFEYTIFETFCEQSKILKVQIMVWKEKCLNFFVGVV